MMQGGAAILMVIVYLGIVVYVISLLSRLVKAAEKIAYNSEQRTLEGLRV